VAAVPTGLRLTSLRIIKTIIIPIYPGGAKENYEKPQVG
jgi:hypothetical protein